MEINLDGGFHYEPLMWCAPRSSADTWGLWTHALSPHEGRFAIRLRAVDRSIPTRRLDAGYYTRVVDIFNA